MQHFDRIMSKGYRFSLCEKSIHFRWWRDTETHELADTALHGLEHGQVITVDQKWNLELGANHIHAEYMIEVRMGGNDLARLDRYVAQEAKDSLRFVPRVDDQRCRVGLQNVAVGLQPPNHKCVDFGHFQVRFRRASGRI